MATKLAQQDFTPALLPGHYVRINPITKYGFYILPRNEIVEILPPKDVNMATPFTASLAALVDTGNPTTIEAEVDDLDMSRNNLAQYKLIAIDDVLFRFSQPAAVGRFNNREGSLRFGKDTTEQFFIDGMWSMLPEIFVFEDVSRPSVEVINTKFSATYYARFRAFGFRYPLEKITDEVTVNSLKEGGIPSLTISVEGTGN